MGSSSSGWYGKRSPWKTTAEARVLALADLAAHPPVRRHGFAALLADIFGGPRPQPRCRLFEIGTREGVLGGERSGERYHLAISDTSHGRLSIRSRDGAVQHIALAATPQPTGGVRWWIECSGCGRRTTKLYAMARGPYRCRQCLGLRYSSQRQTRAQRLASRAARLYARAGGAPGASACVKPARMHWRTYHRLIDQAEGYELASLAGLVASTDRLVSVRCC